MATQASRITSVCYAPGLRRAQPTLHSGRLRMSYFPCPLFSLSPCHLSPDAGASRFDEHVGASLGHATQHPG